MKIKNLFLSQNILILAVSSIVTALIAFTLLNYFPGITNIFIKEISKNPITIISNDNKTIYASKKLSDFEINNILFSSEKKFNDYKLDNIHYTINSDTFSDKYRITILTPSIDPYKYYMNLFGFMFIIFVVVFILCTIAVFQKNSKDITIPIKKLKEQSQYLASGNLDTPVLDDGIGEINELCKSIESLRLKLKEQVYLNAKTDENRQFLISSISHDLRTPVTSLRGYIEGVLDNVADTEEKKELYLKKAVSKTVLINNMIEDLMLYSKLDLHQIEFNLEKIDIANYIEIILEDNRHIFNKKNEKLTMTNELMRQYFVLVDINKFDRVIENILTNADKYISKDSGKIEIILRESASSVIIEIKDNGKGIEKKDLPLIFDKFYRCEQEREIKGSSGLGLAISKQMVESMNGRIWAMSEINVGTSIMISLKKYL